MQIQIMLHRAKTSGSNETTALTLLRSIAATLLLVSVPWLSSATAQEVTVDKSLVLLDPSVLDSCHAASQLDSPRCSGLGAWSFGGVMKAVAGSQNAAVFTEKFLGRFITENVVNTFPVTEAKSVSSGKNHILEALNVWPRDSAGNLNLAKAPFRLITIVNRADIRNTSSDGRGELRFVYGLVDSTMPPRDPSLPPLQNGLPFFLIFEFQQPDQTCAAKVAAAKKWNALGARPFGSTFNSALKSLTTRVTAARPSNRPNRSYLKTVRVNFAITNSEWDLREYRLGLEAGSSAAGQQLLQTTVENTPDWVTFSGTPALAAYINANRRQILKERMSVPLSLSGGTPFRAAVAKLQGRWEAPGVDPTLLRSFNRQTCNGCHGQDNNTFFVQIGGMRGRDIGDRPLLSAFLNGQDGQSFVDHNGVAVTPELLKRKKDFQTLLKTTCQ